LFLTTRALLLLLLAALPIAAATWIPSLRWAALIYLLIYVLILLLDWRQAGGVERFEAWRTHDSKLSLGSENAILLTLRASRPLAARRPRPIRFWIRDEPPDEFQVGRRILAGTLKPAEKWQENYTVRPLQRGDYRFGAINLRWLGPLGLVVRQGRIPASGPVKVYPNLLDVRRYDLFLRQNRLQELGLRHARLLGQGTEFERLREYTPDDEYRHINWKATARRLRPITMEYETERSQNIMAVVDTGRMMRSPVEQIAKLDYVINAVLLLGFVATGMGDKVGLLTFADEAGAFLAPRQGRRQFYRMLELLYSVKAEAVESDYRKALATLARKKRKRALVVIFTELASYDAMSHLQESVAVLARRDLPLVVTISDPDIHRVAVAEPQDTSEVYRQVAANQLLDERRLTLQKLERKGVLTLDVPANALSLAVIQRYLELKGNRRL